MTGINTLLASERAHALIDRFTWLIESYSPDIGPQRSKLCIMSNGHLAQLPTPKAEDNLVHWALTGFNYIKFAAGLHKWPIEFRPRLTECPTSVGGKSLGKLSCSSDYYINALGHPLITYDDQRLTEAGYLLHKSACGVADFLFISASQPSPFKSENPADYTILCAAFLGLGLAVTLRDAPDSQTRKEAIFSTCIYMAVKGYNYARLLTLHGDMLDSKTREQMKTAFTQLKEHKFDIEYMRLLAMSEYSLKEENQKLYA